MSYQSRLLAWVSVFAVACVFVCTESSLLCCVCCTLGATLYAIAFTFVLVGLSLIRSAPSGFVGAEAQDPTTGAPLRLSLHLNAPPAIPPSFRPDAFAAVREADGDTPTRIEFVITPREHRDA